MIDILRFDPCKIDDCEENPIKWPRERWFNQLKQLDKKILKKIDKKVNEFLPNKELKLAIDNYQKISKEKPVQKDSILIGDNDVQARAINF